MKQPDNGIARSYERCLEIWRTSSVIPYWCAPSYVLGWTCDGDRATMTMTLRRYMTYAVSA
jgi:hypothetical protein